jgi:cobalt-zinc-cadmium efflux system protein
MTYTHHHTEDRQSLNRRLWISLGLNLTVTVVEIIGGVLSGSLGLLADAVHNLSDVAALGLAIVARALGRRPATHRFTYGLKRAEVLAAVLNALVLGVITIFIAHEAITRLLHPVSLSSRVMLPVALVALLANLGSVFLLREHDRDDLNVRSAFLHLVQDSLSSLIVVVAALFAHSRFGLYLDPIAALVIGLGVAWSAASIIWQATGTLIEATPGGFDLEKMVLGVAQQFAPVRCTTYMSGRSDPGKQHSRLISRCRRWAYQKRRPLQTTFVFSWKSTGTSNTPRWKLRSTDVAVSLPWGSGRRLTPLPKKGSPPSAVTTPSFRSGRRPSFANQVNSQASPTAGPQNNRIGVRKV